MSKLLGFTGKMGSGKSTAIALLHDVQHNRIHNLKFAQPLYDMQEYIYRRISSVYKKPEGFIKDRKLLQILGTDWGRNNISPTLWVDLWKEEVKYILENYSNTIVVCDDVRFDNEAEIIKSLGGYVVQVKSEKNQERIKIPEGTSLHASEQGVNLEYVDYIIENSGTIDDLKTSLLTLNARLGLW